MADFNLVVPFIHEKEGGFVNDPHDAGGATNMGVTLETFTHYCQSKGLPRPSVQQLRNLSEVQWQDIMRTRYWDVIQGDRISSQSVALALMDWAVHSGPRTPIKKVQAILGVKADGIVGPVTLSAINSYSPLPLFGQIQLARRKFLGSLVVSRPANSKFLEGWLNRVASIRFSD